jgi:hypothetical protein
MAFKGFGVGDFVYPGPHGSEVRIPGTVEKHSGRGRVTVDGVDFTPKRRVYPGVPTPKMLQANNIHLTTMKGRPWPGSAADRLCKSAPDSASRINRDGEQIDVAGPNSMLDLQKRGMWPDEEERALQAQAEAKLANPIEYAKRSLMAQGLSPEKALAQATAHGKRHEMIDVSDLLPQPKSDKPMKGAAA